MTFYEATFRSNTKEIIDPPLIKEFGGLEATQLSYRFETIMFPAQSSNWDKKAMERAKLEAVSRNMILIEVKRVKVLYTCKIAP